MTILIDTDHNRPATIYTPPENTAARRFAIFKSSDAGWVLRDYRANRDYPFWTKAGAVAGMAKRRTHSMAYLGSPIEVAQYGEPLEAVEYFA